MPLTVITKTDNAMKITKDSLTASLSDYLEQVKLPDSIKSEILEDSLPTIRKIAKAHAKVDPVLAHKSMMLLAKGSGLHSPLIALGLKSPPRYGAQWMANVRIARFEINAEEYFTDLLKEMADADFTP